jgi:hypothetical protein
MLTHTEEFSDKWSIKTVTDNENFLVSLTISGSDGSDGTVPGGFGQPVNLIVTGARWRVTMTFVEMLGGGPLPPDGIPLPSQIRRFIRYDLPDGLVKTFTDVAGGLLVLEEGLPVLICKNLDPNVNPFAGAKNPYDFTIDRRMLREPPKQVCD